MAAQALGWMDDRSEPRDVVHHRTRARLDDERSLTLVIVNTSAGGLMARCEAPVGPGDRLFIDLPVVGNVVAEVRWSLGGRIGCRLTPPLATEDYYVLLGALRR